MQTIYRFSLILFIIFSLNCNYSEKNQEKIIIGSMDFIQPVTELWTRDSLIVTSKFYPEYNEKSLTIKPTVSFSLKNGDGAIIISQGKSKKNLQESINESIIVFRRKKTEKAQLFEESYSINNIQAKHFLLDTSITFTRVYLISPEMQDDVVIVDFICPPTNYPLLSASFKKFLFSFRQL